jgi:hypothetical protein
MRSRRNVLVELPQNYYTPIAVGTGANLARDHAVKSIAGIRLRKHYGAIAIGTADRKSGKLPDRRRGQAKEKASALQYCLRGQSHHGIPLMELAGGVRLVSST